MKLVCKSCGAVASAEIWGDDGPAREFAAVVAGLPAPLPPVALQYIGLFRPAKSGLSWKKALRIATEIRDMVAGGYVKKQGAIDRSCPPRIWAMAIERMLEQRAGLDLPMESHVYLRKIAHGMAEQAAVDGERSVREAEVMGKRPPARLPETEPDDGLLPMERELRRRGMSVPVKALSG